MFRPQFSLQRLLVSVTLVAIGVAMLAAMFSDQMPSIRLLRGPFWVLPFPCIAIGVMLLLFRRPKVAIGCGAAIGAAAQLMLCLYASLMYASAALGP